MKRLNIIFEYLLFNNLLFFKTLNKKGGDLKGLDDDDDGSYDGPPSPTESSSKYMYNSNPVIILL